jgi:hypothetical protein
MAGTKYVLEPDDASEPTRRGEALPDAFTPSDADAPAEVGQRDATGLQIAGTDAAPSQGGYNAEEEEEIRRRLEDLGYI